MAILTIQELTAVGSSPTYAAADTDPAGDRFDPLDYHTPLLLHVKNGTASPKDVVVDDPTSEAPVGATAFDPDLTITVPANDDMMVALSPSRFRNNGAGGGIYVTYPDGATSITLAMFRLSP